MVASFESRMALTKPSAAVPSRTMALNRFLGASEAPWSPGGGGLVDPAGIVVQSSPKRPDGVPVADLAHAKLGSTVFRTMTEVVLSLPSTIRGQVTDVRASTADDVALTLSDGSSVVWGSPDASSTKAALLAALVKDHAARDPDRKVEFDVSAPDNGIVRAKD